MSRTSTTSIDSQLALDMLHCARRRVKVAQRCEEFMRHVKFYSAQYIGLAHAAQRELATARMLLQAARRVHPATTPKGKRPARPVPPKTGPGSTTLTYRCNPILHGCTSQTQTRAVALFTEGFESPKETYLLRLPKCK